MADGNGNHNADGGGAGVDALSEVHLPQKTMVGQLWDIFLIAMVSYFVISIINSSVQQYLRDRDEAQLETTNSPKNPTAKKQTNKKGK